MNLDLFNVDGRLGLWSHVWRMYGFAPRAGLFEELEAAYGEHHRHYHNVLHLAECLNWLQTWWAHAERPHEVAVALWFHDAVYQPQEKENELRSAGWAARELSKAGVGTVGVQRIYDLVMSTAHDAPGLVNSPDAELLHDIDLSVLGATPARYAQYADGIRKEYAFGGASYARGRSNVLRLFLARQRIFVTSFAAPVLEECARDNLVHELNSLE